MAKKTKDEQVPFDGPQAPMAAAPVEEAQAVAAPEAQAVAVVAPKTVAVAAPRPKLPPRPEVAERVLEAKEALETFVGLKLPQIRFKEGFTMAEGEDEIESFTGVIVYTKESNVFYATRYKQGEKRLPDCVSNDGRKPSGPKPFHPNCASCPNNQFGSAKEGDGKACKNTRHVFVLVQNQEGEFGVMPKLLRVPPTSLVLVKAYVMGLAADFGSYFAVKTKFEVFKRSDSQTHYNIRFSPAGRLSAQEKADVEFIREGWLPLMKDGDFSDGAEDDEPARPAAPQAAPAAEENRF